MCGYIPVTSANGATVTKLFNISSNRSSSSSRMKPIVAKMPQPTNCQYTTRYCCKSGPPHTRCRLSTQQSNPITNQRKSPFHCARLCVCNCKTLLASQHHQIMHNTRTHTHTQAFTHTLHSLTNSLHSLTRWLKQIEISFRLAWLEKFLTSLLLLLLLLLRTRTRTQAQVQHCAHAGRPAAADHRPPPTLTQRRAT